MTISLYDPRSIARALLEMKRPKTFLGDLFFAGAPQLHLTTSFDVDIQTGTRRAAEFSNPAGRGKAVDREGFTSYNFAPPTTKPKMAITLEHIATRLPGEHIYSGQAPQSRAQKLLLQDMETLNEMIARTEEIMRRDALVDGAITISENDVDQVITFPARDGSLTLGLLAAADRWSADTSDPAKNLRAWRRAVAAQTGLTADTLILGTDAIDALLANLAVQRLLDNRRMDFGAVSEQYQDSGAIYYGAIGGVNVWGYNELDPDGDPLISAKTALLGSKAARCEMDYGPVGLKVGEGSAARVALQMGARVPKSWCEDDPAVQWLQMSASPLPVPIQNNAFLTATVLA